MPRQAIAVLEVTGCSRQASMLQKHAFRRNRLLGALGAGSPLAIGLAYTLFGSAWYHRKQKRNEHRGCRDVLTSECDVAGVSYAAQHGAVGLALESV